MLKFLVLRTQLEASWATPGDVGRAVLVQPRHELDSPFSQQREHEPAAVVAVGQDQVATGEFVAASQLLEQRAEEGRLAGLITKPNPSLRPHLPTPPPIQHLPPRVRPTPPRRSQLKTAR